MKTVKTKYQEFRFKENVVCPNCGKKGLWTRDESVTDDGKPYFCIGCANSFGIIMRGPMGFIHPQDKEIFAQCQQAENIKQTKVTITNATERMEV